MAILDALRGNNSALIDPKALNLFKQQKEDQLKEEYSDQFAIIVACLQIVEKQSKNLDFTDHQELVHFLNQEFPYRVNYS